MGNRRPNAQALTGVRDWPLIVRRARPEDGDAVVAFTTGTWDGWDYLPRAWPVWLNATDGIVLVGTPAGPAGGSPPHDQAGQPLTPGRPVAVTRVALLSPSEAWLEGIRVDKRVRGLDIATDLQVAELRWAAALGARVVRYGTGAHNQASHRLGARHGFRLLVAFSSRPRTNDPETDERDSAFDAAVRAAATVLRQRLLSALADEGWIAQGDDANALWQALSADPTFVAGARLYEPRPWALRVLTRATFEEHVRREEVIVNGSPTAGSTDWALGIVTREHPPAEDATLRLALLAGHGHRALALVEKVRATAGQAPRFRLPEGAALLDGCEEDFARAGYAAGDWLLHILERPIDADHPLPEADGGRLILGEPPAPVIRAT
jgi:GNAT superfamily N-acetyltransferase